jgi:hypothetical protein
MPRKKEYKSAAERQKAYRLRKGQKARTILRGIVVSHPRGDSSPMGAMTSWNVKLPNGGYVNITSYDDNNSRIVEQFLKQSKIPREPFYTRWKSIMKNTPGQ